MAILDLSGFEGHLSFSSITLYSLLYFGVERIFKILFRQYIPGIYSSFYRDRKDAQYFAFIMGILITVVTTPFCYNALQESSDTNDGLGNPNLPTSGQICVASRSVLWLSELNRLDHSNAFLAHHISSLSYLIWHVQIQMPMRIIYAFNTSLITELFSDIACLMNIHGFKATNSSMAYGVQALNTAFLVVIRLPPIIYSVKFLSLHSVGDPRFWTNMICLAIYARFIVNLVISNCNRLQIFKIKREQPTHLRVFQRFDISVYGIFFSVASFVAAVMTAKVYIDNLPTPVTEKELSRLNLQLLLVAMGAIVGSRVPSVAVKSGPMAIFTRQLFEETPIWLQGGMLGAAIIVIISPLTNRYRLFLSLAASLPIGEAIGRVGCFFAGCCSGGGSSGTSMSVQTKASILNAILGISTLGLYGSENLTLQGAAVLSLSCNALIRIFLRPNIFAIAQFILSAAVFATNQSARKVDTLSFPVQNMPVGIGNQSAHIYNALFSISNGGGIQTELRFWTSALTFSLALAAIAAGTFAQVPVIRREMSTTK